MGRSPAAAAPSHMVLIWLQFLACAAVIGFAGVRLSRYGDAIAALTGMSRSWVGMILVATVTSLPELVTGLSAVTLAQAPDLAVGNVLGSCVVNLTLLALVDAARPRVSLYAVVEVGHRTSAAFCLLTLAWVALAIVLSGAGLMPSIGHVSLASVVTAGLYLLAMRIIFIGEQQRSAHSDRTQAPVAAAATGAQRLSLRAALAGYAAASAAIVGAGIWLPMIGVALAEAMGWSHSLVGTLVIAFATTVPELATTVGAVRMGAPDLAVGSLIGSNLFDLLILAVDDFAYVQGPLFTAVSPVHAVTALIAALMTAVVLGALFLARRATGIRHVKWASPTILLLCLLSIAVQNAQG
jgi:cation:H+ antiporter